MAKCKPPKTETEETLIKKQEHCDRLRLNFTLQKNLGVIILSRETIEFIGRIGGPGVLIRYHDQ